MVEETTNINLISKKNAGFPAYLNFDKLRTEGIEHLGELAGKIWTDHNAHDPGITILEVLCYALLDLGYRTNIPVEDIIARNPNNTTKDDQFFTAAEILTCNPLTIIDYRKLLIDIPGVKNAWLEVATDQKDICQRRDNIPTDVIAGTNVENNITCDEYLNGIYHVFIETEKNIEEEFTNEVKRKEYIDDLILTIKKTLYAHRNLCEDFADITLLCKQKTGICADIELEAGTDTEKTYFAIIEKLRDFFSPSPHFYTLQQLLDKNKPIEDIFSGRPHNISSSNGFIDTKELEEINLKKEIHLSDVYNVIFEIPGIKKIKKIVLRLEENGTMVQKKGWKIALPKNNISDFLITETSISFSINDIPVLFDAKKYDTLFELNFTNNGKLLYETPSQFLDSEIPKGIYRTDLDEYFSIQNDFPRVYGIAEGGLADDVSDKRKVEALQLKGYLLFFDQLLCNYLAQLKNIRALFSVSENNSENKKQTYFSNKLTTVPNFDKLLRFAESDSVHNRLGTKGDKLMYPVAKDKLLELIANKTAQNADPQTLTAFTFSSLTEQEISLNILKNNFYNGNIEVKYINEGTENIYYYVAVSTNEFVLVSNKYFTTQAAAKQHADSINYIATFDENYRTFITADNRVSFNIELNMATYEEYLQGIIEDQNLYTIRRNYFLNHLLARFAERFTDFAMLSFGNVTTENAALADIKNKELFVSSYDKISSNRGRAYDYNKNNWLNDNISGFENEVKYLSGIENKKLHSLCNFVVEAYDEEFIIDLKTGEDIFFGIKEKFSSRENASAAIRNLFTAMADKNNYRRLYDKDTQEYLVQVKYDEKNYAVYPEKFSNSLAADDLVERMYKTYLNKPLAEDIFVSKYKYQIQLNDSAGNTKARYTDFFNSVEEANDTVKKLTASINYKKKWVFDNEKDNLIGNLFFNKSNTDAYRFINTSTFKIDINSSIIGKPDKFTYEALDKGNTFKLCPVIEFDKEKEAENHFKQVLGLAANKNNYSIIRNNKTGNFTLQIIEKGIANAICYEEFETQEAAEAMLQKMNDFIKQQEYTVTVETIPDQWKYNYNIGYRGNNRYSFVSMNGYESAEAAFKAATAFSSSGALLKIKKDKQNIILSAPDKGGIRNAVSLLSAENEETKSVEKEIEKILHEKREVESFLTKNKKSAFYDAVKVDESNGPGHYVYRLVDKDNVIAHHAYEYENRETAEKQKRNIYTQLQKSLKYTDICLGGDIIKKITKTKSTVPIYRYQIKDKSRCYTTGENAGKQIVFFESRETFSTAELAQEAFEKNYIYILGLATDVNNYGKYIQLTEPAGTNKNDDVIVFIPSDTTNEIEKVYQKNIVQWMLETANSYPIKRVEYGSAKFNELFCGDNDSNTKDNCACTSEEIIYKYYFSIYGDEKMPELWLSNRFYDNLQDVRNDFNFFLMLTSFSGNLFIDCDACLHKDGGKYKIYIREVLAESVKRYEQKDIQQIWGRDGIEKFICAVQQQNSFRNYQDREDCCYSFYVNCGQDFIIHPCKYDTTQQRNKVMYQLQEKVTDFVEKKSYSTEIQKEKLLLLNADGKPFAFQTNNATQNIVDVFALISIVENIYNTENQITEKESELFLLDKAGKIVLQSFEKGYNIIEWRKTLNEFACYFPIVKKTDIKTNSEKYCIEIKLPSFGNCNDVENDIVPCNCDDKPTERESICDVAWKSSCCYDLKELRNLWGTYLQLQKILISKESYRAVFDCECNSFGIAFHFNNAIRSANDVVIQKREIVAYNPQCYTLPNMVCDAVERTKQLVNAEGLHLVEHILLRPKTEVDCRCRNNNGCGERNCGYEWKFANTDPCNIQNNSCFYPGADPFSFIATVALPAWPKRFRTAEGRMIMENIMYRTAPAHVLLRILWLTPYDFCRFETKYKKWHAMLAQKNNCIGNFDTCEMLDFVFKQEFTCLDECKDCLPCQDDASTRIDCFENDMAKKGVNNFVNEINELHCFGILNCGDNREHGFQDVNILEKNTDVKNTPVVQPTSVTVFKNTEVAKSALAKKTEKVVEKEQEVVTKIEKLVTKKSLEKSKAISLPAFVNGRFAAYKKAIENIKVAVQNNIIAVKADRFLKTQSPTEAQVYAIVSEIIQNKKPTDNNGLVINKSRKYSLLENIICYVLDKAFFEGAAIEQIKLLTPTFNKIENAGIDMSTIYENWNSKEVKKYLPKIDEKEIKKTVTGIGRK
jgi:hypothetical protein